MSGFSQLWKKLAKSKKYREEFVAAQVKRGIPFQIRTLLKKTGLSQEEVASRAGLTQGVVSRAANPEYGNLTLNTIIRIAAGFDVAFVGKFVPFSELAEWFTDLSEESVAVKTFGEENKDAKQQPKQGPELVATTVGGIGFGSRYRLDAAVGYRKPFIDMELYNVSELPLAGNLASLQTMTLTESISPESDSTHRFSMSTPVGLSNQTESTLREIAVMRKPAVRAPAFDNTEVTNMISH